jgi:hypothetical protein
MSKLPIKLINFAKALNRLREASAVRGYRGE